MLNKELCKKCINNYHQASEIYGWEKDDEKNWNINIIFCVHDSTYSYSGSNLLSASASLSGYRSINDPPPENCPYYLEHILSKPLMQK